MTTIEISDLSGYLPIRTVSDITGVNAVTIRAWERRHNLICPRRTAKGHRLYSQKDVARINQILGFLDQGISIGQVKPLLDEADDFLVTTIRQDDLWIQYQQKTLNAVYQFDEMKLDTVFNDAFSLYPVSMVISRLIIPTLKQLGQDWKNRGAGIAEEHFYSVNLRNKIGSRLHYLGSQAIGKHTLVIFCLPGEHHELGMLFFSLVLAGHGYRIITLGANLPLEQIPKVIERRSIGGLIISATTRISKGLLKDDLPQLLNAVKVPVFIGGASAQNQSAELGELGLEILDLDFMKALKRVNQLILNRPGFEGASNPEGMEP